jgi:uncharacterized cofD-like protein
LFVACAKEFSEITGEIGSSARASRLRFVTDVQSTSTLRPRVVALGGGTGLPTVLRGLRESASVSSRAGDITAIVTVMDDGGSSGELRKTVGMLPPGDIRNCLSALSNDPTPLGEILHERVATRASEIAHPVGNLMLAALSGIDGDFVSAIGTLGRLLGTTGRVLPATLDDVHLHATFSDGLEVEGETAIARRRRRISRVRLTRTARPLPEAIEALIAADLVVVGPGSLYTSSIPPLLVDGMASLLAEISATKVYVANLMTQPGETDGYTLADHLRAMRDHTSRDLFDYALVDRTPLSTAALKRYEQEGSRPVVHDARQPWPFRTRIVNASIASTRGWEIRHDPSALGYALRALSGRAREGVSPGVFSGLADDDVRAVCGFDEISLPAGRFPAGFESATLDFIE